MLRWRLHGWVGCYDKAERGSMHGLKRGSHCNTQAAGSRGPGAAM